MFSQLQLDEAQKKQLLKQFQKLFGETMKPDTDGNGISIVDLSTLVGDRRPMMPAAALAHFITILGLAQLLAQKKITPTQMETILVGLFSPKALEWGKAAVVEFPAMVQDEAAAIQGAIRGDGSFDVKHYQHISFKLNADGIMNAMKQQAAASTTSEPKKP